MPKIFFTASLAALDTPSYGSSWPSLEPRSAFFPLESHVRDRPDAAGPSAAIRLVGHRLHEGVHNLRQVWVIRLERVPSFPNSLGSAMNHLHNHAEAVVYFQAAVVVRKDSATAHNNLGGSLANTSRHAEAVDQYEIAVALDPTCATFRSNLALALWRLKRRDEASQQVRVAIEFSPKDVRLRTAFGMILEADGKADAAVAEHREAVRLDPRRQAAQNELRRCLVRLGRWDDELDSWQEAIVLAPDYHATCYGYAELCLFLGKKDAFRDARRQLVAKFGQTTNPQIAERVSRAYLLMREGEELQQAALLARQTNELTVDNS